MSTFRSQPRGINEDELNDIQSSGRRVLYSAWGQPIITSRPGASIAPADATDSTSRWGIGGDIGTDQRKSDWNQFFRQHAAPVVGATPAASASSIAPGSSDEDAAAFAGSGSPTSYGSSFVGHTVPTAATHIAASIAKSSQWLGQNGVAFPPPPSGFDSLYPTGTNAMRFPTGDPALQKSSFVGANGVDPDYANRVSAFNTNLYKPADTVRTPAVAGSNWPTGWQGPTAPVKAGNYVTPFGPASVNFGSRIPTLPASNTNWSQNDDA